MAKKYQKCPDCNGSGHRFFIHKEHRMVEHCEACRGTGRVLVDEVPEETEADRNRKATYTGDNT